MEFNETDQKELDQLVELARPIIESLIKRDELITLVEDKLDSNSEIKAQ